MENSNTSVIIASHAYPINGRFGVRSGPVQPLLDYFSKKTKYVFIIAQPPPFTEGSLDSMLFVYSGGILREKSVLKLPFLSKIPQMQRKNRTYLRLKLRDFLSVLYFSRLIKKKYSDGLPVVYFFGLESVNAAAGHFARHILKVKYLIYYVFDWSVRWFKNPVFNSVYLFFDRFACSKSDYTWNITQAIENARRHVLRYPKKILDRQITVPYAMPLRKDVVAETDGILNTIVYSGYLSEENGAELLPDIALELNRLKPDIKLLVIGGGELFDDLSRRIFSYGLKNCILKGEISETNRIDELVCGSQIAIAPYKDIKYSKKKYGDVIKIRSYFACGLPVISTGIVPVSKEIAAENLGAVVPYDAQVFARECVKFLNDAELYRKTRANVIKKMEDFSWDKVFKETTEIMEKTGENS